MSDLCTAPHCNCRTKTQTRSEGGKPISRLRDNRFSTANPHARRANQEWDLAGAARQDGDAAAEENHTDNARKHEQRAREWEG